MSEAGEQFLDRAAHGRAMEEFRRVLDSAALPYRMGQLELFSDEEEQFIQHEVDRKLHKPKLPNAGARERLWLEKLKAFARDESLVVTLKLAAGRYATALEALLPRQEYIRKKMRRFNADGDEVAGDGRESEWMTLPGCYYTRKPVTAKTNKALFAAALELKKEATKDMDKKWLAQFLLDGEPETVANFKMECLYLLRGADGNVTRLVRLVNTLGEVSEGREIGGADVLPADEFCSAEKFRGWCLSKGNFNWGVGEGAGNLELQMLQSDTSSAAAYRVVKLIEYCGWHEVLADDHRENLVPGQVRLKGIWFMDECAYADGQCIMPDDEGIFWHDGVGYAFARKGRETEFTHGRPQMKPGLKLEQVKFDRSQWVTPADGLVDANNLLGQFFRETCRRFFDTAGGYEGWMSVGAMLGFAAAPEIYKQRHLFPSLWVPGQMGSGKTVYCSWLMSLQGFQVDSGLGLISRNVTPVGIMCQLENYSNLALWVDEFRQAEVGPEKLAILRDAYNRQLAAKWSPDGFQRVIRTALLVSGESTTSDAATRSRYPHILLSEQKRKCNHYAWFLAHQEYFFFFWRTIMERRAEFVELVRSQVESWMQHEDLQRVPSRDRITHAVCYASLAAAAVLFESHDVKELAEYRKFIASHAAASAMDVQTDVNVNVFMQDLTTAVKADEIPLAYFRVEKILRPHPPEAPNQGLWHEYMLFMDPDSVISALQIYLRKAGQTVTLRYKDLRDQLSKNDFWVKAPDGKKLNRRFGKRGSMTTSSAWGFKLDLHPLGLQRISDDTYREALKSIQGEAWPTDVMPVFTDGDPRKGDLFAIIEAVEKSERRERQAETGGTGEE